MQENTLFINPLEEKILFSTFGEVRHEEFVEINFLEFAENFPRILTNFVKKYNIKKIFCINWPAPFTKIRIVTLAINSLKFANKNIKLKSIHLFDIIDNQKYIPIIQANKNEFLIRKNGEEYYENVEVVSKNVEQLSKFDKKFCGFVEENIKIPNFEKFKISINEIEKFFENIDEVDFISPIYIKSPHITNAGK